MPSTLVLILEDHTAETIMSVTGKSKFFVLHLAKTPSDLPTLGAPVSQQDSPSCF